MTICHECGTEREFIDAACPSCHFHPKTLRELATAALLTMQFEAGDESFGMNPHTLDAMARQLRAGSRPVLEENELLRHERTVEAFLEVKPIHLVRTLVALFQPAILFIAALLAIYLILRFSSVDIMGHSQWRPNFLLPDKAPQSPPRRKASHNFSTSAPENRWNAALRSA